MKWIIFLIALYSMASCVKSTPPNECSYYATVKEIGGCNRYACGVKFTDNSIGTLQTPVVGQTVCRGTRSIGEFKWKWLWIN